MAPSGDGGPVLLPHEVPESEFLDEASHWVAVYSELLAAAQAAGWDAEVARLQARLVFWIHRQKELRDRSA